MCGITGWVDHERDLSTDPSIIAAMTATLTPRGPDDVGTYVSRAVALGHRRLAVLDPAHGAQPMVRATATGEVVLVFSGEVYNFTELRRRLIGRGHRFVTGTDTEVVLAAYLEWGLRAPERLEGMFAFAVWDGRTRRLHPWSATGLGSNRCCCFALRPGWCSPRRRRLCWPTRWPGLSSTGTGCGGCWRMCSPCRGPPGRGSRRSNRARS